MGFFDAFRIYGGPTLYPSAKTPVTADLVEIGFTYAIVILLFSFLIILPGFRGKERCYFFIRSTIGCFVLVSIMVCNFGQEWERAEVKNIRTYYKAGFPGEIKNATVGVSIGLRSVNITLKTTPVKYQLNELTTEEIDYNERFHWNSNGWVQGRGGFGAPAGLVNREFRAAQLKGSPFPILWIAEYFTIDGEGIRWGRYYRQAGFYTHVLLWLALPLWLLSIILFKVVLPYGAYFSMATGATLLLGNILYATIRNPNVLAIPIGDHLLSFSWGWAFWLNLVNGLLALFIGIIVFFMNIRFREEIFTFFGVDILQDIEEYYMGIEELRAMGIHIARPTAPTQEGESNKGFSAEPGDVVINASEPDVTLYDNVEGIQRAFRRKNQGTIGKRLQRSVRRSATPASQGMQLTTQETGSHKMRNVQFQRGALDEGLYNPTKPQQRQGIVPRDMFVLQPTLLSDDQDSYSSSDERPFAPSRKKHKSKLKKSEKGRPAKKQKHIQKKGIQPPNRRPPRPQPRLEEDTGRYPVPNNMALQYRTRYLPNQLPLVTSYEEMGMTGSEGALFLRGSHWRPPSQSPPTSLISNGGYHRQISDPGYPYRIHSNIEHFP